MLFIRVIWQLYAKLICQVHELLVGSRMVFDHVRSGLLDKLALGLIYRHVARLFTSAMPPC